MALKSQLFQGDSKLEAALNSDPAHIVPGSRGEHVRKIQLALIKLDGAAIDADGSYGPKTAAAVLAYKQKRDIVNRSYQTTADNVVGKMTMARLDADMLQLEVVPTAGVKITPASFFRVRPPRSPAVLALVNSSQPLALNSNSTFAVGAPSILPVPTFPVGAPSILPNTVLEMRRNSVAKIIVERGAPGEVVVGDPSLVKIAQDAPVPAGDRALVLLDSQPFRIFSGKTLGRTTITATSLGSTASIDVVVKTFLTPPKFVPGVNHAHTPSGRYADVQANPNSDFLLEIACKIFDPLGLVNLAKRQEFADKPIATKHLDFYLKDGKGADFNEDANIKDWLTRDSGIRRRLKREIFPVGGRPRGEGHFTFEQADFGTDQAGQDFRFAFGGIDRVDFEVDFSQDTVRVWFQDRYEWHPFYPFYTNIGPTAAFPTSGDGPRGTNCLHAALVELKTSGAADFWMKGQAEVSLSSIVRP